MGVLSLGGGFYGLVLVVSAALKGGPLEQWITLGISCAICLFYTWSGLRLLERAPGAERLNVIGWWSQIFVFKSPVIGLVYYIGASATVSVKWGDTGNLGFNANGTLGSAFYWNYMQGDTPWEFGVNVLALTCAIWGGKLLRRQSSAPVLDLW